MSIVAEICLYLIVVLGIVCATIAACSDDGAIKQKYTRTKNSGSNVLLEMKFTGVTDADLQDTSYAIANGLFDNIYDLVDEFKVYKKDI